MVPGTEPAVAVPRAGSRAEAVAAEDAQPPHEGNPATLRPGPAVRSSAEQVPVNAAAEEVPAAGWVLVLSAEPERIRPAAWSHPKPETGPEL